MSTICWVLAYVDHLLPAPAINVEEAAKARALEELLRKINVKTDGMPTFGLLLID
jgi:hypothetical protein